MSKLCLKGTDTVMVSYKARNVSLAKEIPALHKAFRTKQNLYTRGPTRVTPSDPTTHQQQPSKWHPSEMLQSKPFVSRYT
jgi:hypothetical protein